MSSSDGFFSDAYDEARERFLAACKEQGLPLFSYENPAKGAKGERLFTDVARIGSEEAEAVLIVESGLHGVEGYPGSAIQLATVLSPDAPRPPDGVALLLVHAINPWGFSWNRRFNEDNIDLNRHFLDWDNPGDLANPGYDELASALVPEDISPQGLEAADAVIARFEQSHGPIALRNAIKRGQYSHPDGIFYGGLQPCWSAKAVERIVREHLAGAKRAGLIDIHTGLGPFGFGECLSSASPQSEEGRRASAWYGDVAHTKDPESGYTGGSASILDGYKRAAPWPEWTPIGLEFGTRAMKLTRDAVRKDGWLHLYGGPDHPLAPQIKAELLHAYYPAEPDWRQAVLSRGLEVVALGLAGLGSARN